MTDEHGSATLASRRSAPGARSARPRPARLESTQGSRSLQALSAGSARAIEAHHRVELVVLRIDERRHGREAGLLERADRGEVADVGVGDAGPRLGAGEDDLRGEGADHVGAEPRPGQACLAEEDVEAGRLVARADERGVVGVVGEEVRLDQPDVLDRRRRSRRGRWDRGPRSRPGTPRPPRRRRPESPHQRRTCSRPSQSYSSGRSLDRERTEADVRLGPPAHPGATAGSSAARSRRGCCCAAADAPAPRTTACTSGGGCRRVPSR